MSRKRDVLELLGSRAISRLRSDGSSYDSLADRQEQELARETGLRRRQIQILALEQEIVPERYIRNQASLSCRDQIRLLQARVAVIGLGGLGGAVVELLARIGVGSLVLIDGDSFEESNLNRQLLCCVGNLGKAKAEVAAERVRSINPALEVRGQPVFIDELNTETLLRGADLAVDCLDTIPDRFTLAAGCKALEIPLVSAAIAGSGGQATVIMPGDDTLSRIYGTPSETSPRKGVEKKLGTLPFAVMAMAAVECAETVAILIGKPAQLEKRLLLADLGDHSLEIARFS